MCAYDEIVISDIKPRGLGTDYVSMENKTFEKNTLVTGGLSRGGSKIYYIYSEITRSQLFVIRSFPLKKG